MIKKFILTVLALFVFAAQANSQAVLNPFNKAILIASIAKKIEPSYVGLNPACKDVEALNLLNANGFNINTKSLSENSSQPKIMNSSC